MWVLLCGLLLLAGLASADNPTSKQLNITKEQNNISKRYTIIPQYNPPFYRNNQVLQAQQVIPGNDQAIINYINTLRATPFAPNVLPQIQSNIVPAIPQRIVPQGIVPQQAIPQQILRVVPQVLPQQIVPQVAPQRIVPQQIFRPQVIAQQVVPQQIVPQQKIVQQQILRPQVPLQLTPQRLLSQQVPPQKIVQQDIFRPQAAPLQLTPQQVLPQQVTPQKTVQQQILQRQGVPLQLTPQQLLPQQVVGPQIVPQRIVPDQAVNQKIVPQQFVPQVQNRIPTIPSQQFIPEVQRAALAQQQIVPYGDSRDPFQQQLYQPQPLKTQVIVGHEPYPYEVPPGQSKIPPTQQPPTYVRVPQEYPVLQNLVYNPNNPVPYLQVLQPRYVNPDGTEQVVRIGYGHPHLNQGEITQIPQEQAVYTQPHHTVYVNPNLDASGNNDQPVVRIGYGHPQLSQDVLHSSGPQQVKLDFPVPNQQNELIDYRYENNERPTRTLKVPDKNKIKPKKADT